MGKTKKNTPINVRLAPGEKSILDRLLFLHSLRQPLQAATHFHTHRNPLHCKYKYDLPKKLKSNNTVPLIHFFNFTATPTQLKALGFHFNSINEKISVWVECGPVDIRIWANSHLLIRR